MQSSSSEELHKNIAPLRHHVSAGVAHGIHKFTLMVLKERYWLKKVPRLQHNGDLHRLKRLSCVPGGRVGGGGHMAVPGQTYGRVFTVIIDVAAILCSFSEELHPHSYPFFSQCTIYFALQGGRGRVRGPSAERVLQQRNLCRPGHLRMRGGNAQPSGRGGGKRQSIPCQVFVLSRSLLLLVCVRCLEIEDSGFVPDRRADIN